MTIFRYLTKHTCPKCRVSLARDPDHADRVVCTICWAVAEYDPDRDLIESLVRSSLTPEEIESLRRRFDCPR
jgi:hypothetical protein